MNSEIYGISNKIYRGRSKNNCYCIRSKVKKEMKNNILIRCRPHIYYKKRMGNGECHLLMHISIDPDDQESSILEFSLSLAIAKGSTKTIAAVD